MYCKNQLSHTITGGDNLYRLAKDYSTSVPEILALNPNIDPYNLQIGSSVVICADNKLPASPWPGRHGLNEMLSLTNRMRMVWEQHVFWTRLLLISIADRLKDQGDVTVRLLKNPRDIGNIFMDYYTPAVADNIANLLTEHLEIGAALITALRDGQTAKANSLNRQWYINAEKMARAFSEINPSYDYEDIKDMLFTHLDLTKKEVAMRLAGSFPIEIETFDQLEREAMMMADAFTRGIIEQFPQRFA